MRKRIAWQLQIAQQSVGDRANQPGLDALNRHFRERGRFQQTGHTPAAPRVCPQPGLGYDGSAPVGRLGEERTGIDEAVFPRGEHLGLRGTGFE
jgi:hypothetical protein